MTLKYRRITRNGNTPAPIRRATSGSAGYDLSAFTDAPVTVSPSKTVIVPTGICVEIPAGHVGLIFIRSSMGVKHGVTLSNSVGVIDSDYRGELMVGLCNLSDRDYVIEPGDRIAQLVIVPYACATPCEAEDLSDTERSTGGFGSTGKK